MQLQQLTPQQHALFLLLVLIQIMICLLLLFFDVQEKYIDDIYFVKETTQVNTILKKRYNNSSIQYVSIIDTLCSSGHKCLAKVDDNNTPLVWDYGHLTLEGSIYIAENVFKPVLNKALQ